MNYVKLHYKFMNKPNTFPLKVIQAKDNQIYSRSGTATLITPSNINEGIFDICSKEAVPLNTKTDINVPDYSFDKILKEFTITLTHNELKLIQKAWSNAPKGTPIFKKLIINQYKGYLTIVSTNAITSFIKLIQKVDTNEEFTSIFDGEQIIAVLQSMRKREYKIRITIGKQENVHCIKIKTDDITIYTKHEQDAYPNILKLIPDAHKQITFNTYDILKYITNIERNNIQYKDIYVTFDNNTLQFYDVTDYQNKKLIDVKTFDYTQQDIEQSGLQLLENNSIYCIMPITEPEPTLNCKYLLDAIQHLGKSSVTINIPEKTKQYYNSAFIIQTK